MIGIPCPLNAYKKKDGQGKTFGSKNNKILKFSFSSIQGQGPS